MNSVLSIVHTREWWRLTKAAKINMRKIKCMMDKTWLNGAASGLPGYYGYCMLTFSIALVLTVSFPHLAWSLNRAIKGIECPMNGFIQAHPAFYYQKKQGERWSWIYLDWVFKRVAFVYSCCRDLFDLIHELSNLSLASRCKELCERGLGPLTRCPFPQRGQRLMSSPVSSSIISWTVCFWSSEPSKGTPSCSWMHSRFLFLQVLARKPKWRIFI